MGRPLGLALAVALVAAGCGGDDQTEAKRQQGGGNATPAIALFRAPQRPVDKLPQRFAAGLERSPVGSSIEVEKSRLALSPNRRTRVFAMPGGGVLCVVSMQGPQGGGFGCGPSGGLNEGYVFAFVRGPSDQKESTVQAMGLLPDGVSTVALVVPGSGTVRTPVRNNAYYAVLPSEPGKLIFTGPDGRHVTRLPATGSPAHSG